ncbi:MAG: MMPL family transporter [Candidatus Bipolaricaulaceae bacterium]
MAKRSVFRALGLWVGAHPFLILFLFLVLMGASLYCLQDFPLRTSYLDLLPANDPLVERYEAVQAELSNLDLAAILLSLRNPPESLEERDQRLFTAAECILAQLNPELVSRASYFLSTEAPLPPELLVFRTLYPEERERLAAIATELFARVPELVGQTPLILPAELPPDPAELDAVLGGLVEAGHRALSLLRELPEIQALVAEASILIQRAQSRALPEDHGQPLLSLDHTQLVIQVWPTQPVYASQAFNRRVREELRRAIQAAHLEELGVEAGLAGGYVVSTEVEDVIRQDMVVVTAVSATLVLLVTILSLGSLILTVAALLPVLASALFILAWAKFSVHGFNLLTTFLPALALGLGIDYSLHFLFRFSEARREGLGCGEAVTLAVQTKGPASFVAALTTALVFFCLLFARSRALWELGLIMGPGLLLSFLSVFIFGPALLTVLGKIFPTLRGRPLLHRDRLYRPYRNLLLLRKGVLLLSLIFLVLAMAQAVKVQFKFASAELAPLTKAQGVLQEILQKFGGELWLGDTFRVFVPEARMLVEASEKLKAHPLVLSVVSARNLLPSELLGQAAALAELPITAAKEGLQNLAQILGSWPKLIRDLEETAARFSLAELQALALGETRRAQVLSRRAGDFFQLAEELAQLEPAALGETLAALRKDLEPLGTFAQKLRALPPEEKLVDQILALLPEEIRAQYHISRGYIIELRVSPELYQGRNLQEFSAWLGGFGWEYVGTPEIQLALEGHMRRDFFLTSGVALLLIFLVVVGNFRRPGRAALALAPLAMGYVSMLGGMALSGLHFNFTNIVISPLLIGLGVDGAVYFLHRWEEERVRGREGLARAAAATAGPILASYFTTMASFGALLAAQTPGLRYLGASALLGLGFTTLWTLVFLPTASGELRRGPRTTKVP